jgi:restriction system protein
MTELIIPTPDKLMWPTLKAIRELGGSARNSEIEVKVIEIEKYSDEVIASMHNERQSRIQYRLAWARTQLKTIGAVESRETTVWVLTDIGQSISESNMYEALKNLRKRDAESKSRAKADLVVGEEVVGLSNNEVAAVGEPWIDEMLEVIKKITPNGFERLCQRILREAGFENVELTKGSNDKGIDETGTMRMGILSWEVMFQCKRYEDKVSSPQMRDFKGAMAGRSEKGLFMTTGKFSKEAEIESKRDGTPPIDLYDGEDLCRLMKRLGLGVNVVKVVSEEIEVQGDFFNNYK